MKHFIKEIELSTKESNCFYDITKEIENIVDSSKIVNGHILIQPMHTTTGIFLNENEERLLQDFVNILKAKVPKNKKYMHDDIELRKDNCPVDEPINGHSHVRATFYSNPSLSLILHKKIIKLGKYQRILFAEFDGPCPRQHKDIRKYWVSIIGK